MVYKECVYIGKPNQTRHLGDHHRSIGVLEQELRTLPFASRVDDLPAIGGYRLPSLNVRSTARGTRP